MAVWPKRSQSELYHAFREADVINYLKFQRIKWPGHVIRMNKERSKQKTFLAKSINNRNWVSNQLQGGWLRDFALLRVTNGQKEKGQEENSSESQGLPGTAMPLRKK
ncbi:hypothetical protein TNCV_16621 [Trichonephila clavipes]|nr:hypothetical protein TNCV_16621 [Trichonephila clavipes]